MVLDGAQLAGVHKYHILCCRCIMRLVHADNAGRLQHRPTLFNLKNASFNVRETHEYSLKTPGNGSLGGFAASIKPAVCLCNACAAVAARGRFQMVLNPFRSIWGQCDDPEAGSFLQAAQPCRYVPRRGD